MGKEEVVEKVSVACLGGVFAHTLSRHLGRNEDHFQPHFYLSEQKQSYEYTYFAVSGENGIVVGILVVGIGVGLSYLQPEPNATVSQWDENLRDRLSWNQMYYEQEPIPSEVPEPEIVPPPQTQLQQPDHGIQKTVLNILFIVLATLTLIWLFVPAIIKDRAEKRAQKNHAGFDDPDHAKAICTMFLYAKRWQNFGTISEKAPADVYNIWLEAAYSDHGMTEQQRKIVHDYMVQTATSVWANADRKKRLYIRYRACL